MCHTLVYTPMCHTLVYALLPYPGRCVASLPYPGRCVASLMHVLMVVYASQIPERRRFMPPRLGGRAGIPQARWEGGIPPTIPPGYVRSMRSLLPPCTPGYTLRIIRFSRLSVTVTAGSGCDGKKPWAQERRNPMGEVPLCLSGS